MYDMLDTTMRIYSIAEKDRLYLTEQLNDFHITFQERVEAIVEDYNNRRKHLSGENLLVHAFGYIEINRVGIRVLQWRNVCPPAMDKEMVIPAWVLDEDIPMPEAYLEAWETFLESRKASNMGR